MAVLRFREAAEEAETGEPTIASKREHRVLIPARCGVPAWVPEPRAVRADFLVELRGFELMAIAWQRRSVSRI
jgi:hypothetical protein